MSLKFVFGPSGSGKSYQLYDYVIRESVKFPDRQYIVLVPEQFTMQTQIFPDSRGFSDASKRKA